jgi:hypothetical protein
MKSQIFKLRAATVCIAALLFVIYLAAPSSVAAQWAGKGGNGKRLRDVSRGLGKEVKNIDKLKRPPAGSAPKLDAEAASGLVQELAEGLSDVIEDEEQVAAIREKWNARRNLAGMSRPKILEALYADVGSVVKDEQVLQSIWDAWTGEEAEEAEEPEDGEDGD